MPDTFTAEREAAAQIGPRALAAVLEKHRRMMDGAALYAAADRSDPFAYVRALAHITSGVAGYTRDGQEAIYTAEPYQEERTIPGTDVTYFATVYRNVKRP